MCPQGLEGRVKGDCESPDMAAGNRTWVPTQEENALITVLPLSPSAVLGWPGMTLGLERQRWLRVYVYWMLFQKT